MHKLVRQMLGSFVFLLMLLITVVGFAAPQQPLTNARNEECPNADLVLASQVDELKVTSATAIIPSAWWRDWEQANSLCPERYSGDSFAWWRDWEHANSHNRSSNTRRTAAWWRDWEQAPK